jgi:putative flippase GtrA
MNLKIYNKKAPQLTPQDNTKISMQGLKYIIVGLITMVIDFGVTWLLLPEFHLIVANSIGFLLANVTNFLLAHRWVFESDVPTQQSAKTYASVLVVSLVGLLLSDFIVWLVISRWDAPFLISKIFAAIICLVWNFGARKIWIYREMKA